jgi:hypothetical protein
MQSVFIRLHIIRVYNVVTFRLVVVFAARDTDMVDSAT